MEARDKIIAKAVQLDIVTNVYCGYQANHISKDLNRLFQFGSVEVGWRESCGKTDNSMKIYREWKKIISMLKKEGFEIKEERINHKNGSPTSAGGFWNSINYTLINHGSLQTKDKG